MLLIKKALITGTGSRLGRGLAECLIREGWAVYGCSRRGCDLSGIHDRLIVTERWLRR